MSESTLGIPARDEPPRGGLRGLGRRVGEVDEIGVIGALIVLVVILALLVPQTFLTAQNFINVSRQASYVGIMAVGMVFVIAMGDIDLSVGSIWMLSSVMMAIALRDGYSIWIAILVCMVVATLCGLLNGALSVALRIPMIIVTLGTLSLYRGLGLVVTNATPVSGYNLDTWFFAWIGGRDPVFGIWISVWVMLIVGVIGWILFNHTAFGRRVQAIGSNAQAARFSGIRISRTRIMVCIALAIGALGPSIGPANCRTGGTERVVTAYYAAIAGCRGIRRSVFPPPARARRWRRRAAGDAPGWHRPCRSP